MNYNHSRYSIGLFNYIEEIEDPRMRDVRILDKLVDDLAKGKEIGRH